MYFSLLLSKNNRRFPEKNRRLSERVAAEEGFEPSQTESESVVLPLHNSAGCQPVRLLTRFIIFNSHGKVKGFFKNI